MQLWSGESQSLLACGLLTGTANQYKPSKRLLHPKLLLVGYVILVSATKIALAEISPITIVWLRFAMGVIILGAAVAVRRQFALPDRSEWGYFALLGFLGITFHQWLQSNALQTSEASTTARSLPLHRFSWLYLAGRILKEKLALAKIIGIALAALGVLLVVSDGKLATSVIGRFRLDRG